MKREIAAVITAVVTTAGLATALALTPLATADQPTIDENQSAILAAMSRDLNITPHEAKLRLDREHASARTDSKLKAALGSAYAGSWLNDDATTLTVAVSDPGRTDEVRALGAVPKTVPHSQSELTALKERLDAEATTAPETVPGWYVDVTTNNVVVLTNAGSEATARAWAKSAGVAGDVAEFVPSAEDPKPFIDIIGGNAYTFGQGRCSIGFSVDGGFVTAGHCGRTGTRTQNPSGTVAGSSFPGNDYAWVRTSAGNTPRPLVNRYPGTVPVAGSQEAPVGSSVCRSGSTTGWRCGTIQQKNASVTYPEGTIYGLTRTNACAEPGDSGGSWLTGDQAQGVTSGGSGNCRTGGTIYFQPVNEILSVYNLNLVTTGDDTPPPTDPPNEGTWEVGTYYEVGSQVTYNGARYSALQSHTAQPGWTPPNTPALWRQL
jgi:streptogrisin C